MQMKMSTFDKDLNVGGEKWLHSPLKRKKVRN